MFDYIKGELVSKNYPYCTVECNNIGYDIFVNSRTFSSLGELGDSIKIFLKLIHREDSMYLCGFNKKQDRVIFDILTTVSGVGVKVALSLLDEFNSNELIEAVIGENHKLISRTKGVGPKMAQKIVLELKDKLVKQNLSANVISSSSNNSAISNETLVQVQTILQSLGYSQNEYNKALQEAAENLKKDDEQELLKEALKILSVF